MIKSGTNKLSRHRLLRQDAEGRSSPTTSSPTPTTSRCPTSTTTATAARPAGRWCCPATTAATDLLHVRLRGHPRVAAAQQRHADGADREDAQRRLLGAAGARAAVPDLQPVHAPRDRRRPLPAGSVPGQHHPAEPDQPGRAGRARLHRQAADAGQSPTARATSRTRRCRRRSSTRTTPSASTTC